MKKFNFVMFSGLLLFLINGVLWAAPAAELLNVSYDPTRELYQEFNQSFSKFWLAKSGKEITVRQSHGGSGKQARAVIDGLEADVVTLALAYDIDAISKNGKLLPENWQTRLPNNSCPYTSTILFLVRKGNPKNIKDWDDLAKPGISVITPNPKTSGGARWNYLAAWGYALKKWGGDQVKAQEFVKKIIKNVPVLDTGARGSTNTFLKGMGDVLISWENEALLAINKLEKDKFEIVVPSLTIVAEPPVSVVDKNVQKHGTKDIAEAYLNYLYSPEGQEIAAKEFYRPSEVKVLDKYKKQFPAVTMFTLKELFGSWDEAHKIHFADGGTFDKIYEK